MKTVNKKGFTLIEVVLVLAIGGLIFLLAFLAFQQVSRNRRDTQVRNDVSRVLAELQNYISDQGGNIPTSADAAGPAGSASLGQFGTFISNYMGGSNFRAPNGNAYQIGSSHAAFVYVTAPGTRGRLIGYQAGQICGEGGIPTATGASAGNFAVFGLLENGSIVCRDYR